MNGGPLQTSRAEPFRGPPRCVGTGWVRTGYYSLGQKDSSRKRWARNDDVDALGLPKHFEGLKIHITALARLKGRDRRATRLAGLLCLVCR